VLFADAGFAPEHSFAATRSRLWGFDASTLRKMLVVLTLGRVRLQTNDERQSQRSELCQELFRTSKTESPDEKLAREDLLRRCRVAAVGHPNRKGAAMYADAISKLLKNLISESGWPKNPRPMTAPANP